jgi:hypothetical protein
MYIKAHVFETMEAANAAIILINQGEGIPVNSEAVTRTYTQSTEVDGIVLIYTDEVTEKYLGEGEFIEIKDQSEI